MEIRLATPADAIAIRAIYAPIVTLTPISFELEPPTVEEMAARITAVLPTYPWLVLTDGGGVAGYASGRPYQARPAYRWSVETSIYMEDGRRGADRRDPPGAGHPRRGPTARTSTSIDGCRIPPRQTRIAGHLRCPAIQSLWGGAAGLGD